MKKTKLYALAFMKLIFSGGERVGFGEREEVRLPSSGFQSTGPDFFGMFKKSSSLYSVSISASYKHISNS